jgi:hypothetical protein
MCTSLQFAHLRIGAIQGRQHAGPRRDDGARAAARRERHVALGLRIERLRSRVGQRPVVHLQWDGQMPARDPLGHEPDRKLAQGSLLEIELVEAGRARQGLVAVFLTDQAERHDGIGELHLLAAGVLFGKRQVVAADERAVEEECRKPRPPDSRNVRAKSEIHALSWRKGAATLQLPQYGVVFRGCATHTCHPRAMGQRTVPAARDDR